MIHTRRQLLIATVVAVLLIGAAWWLTRPRIDPQLVGLWESVPSRPLLPIESFHPTPLALNADGTTTGLDGVFSHRWCVDGDRLVFYQPSTVPTFVVSAVEKTTGFWLGVGDPYAMDLHVVDEDTIKLSNMTFQRIADARTDPSVSTADP